MFLAGELLGFLFLNLNQKEVYLEMKKALFVLAFAVIAFVGCQKATETTAPATPAAGTEMTVSTVTAPAPVATPAKPEAKK